MNGASREEVLDWVLPFLWWGAINVYASQALEAFDEFSKDT